MKIKGPFPNIPPTLARPVPKWYGARPRSYAIAVAMPRFEDMFATFYALEIIKGVGIGCSRLGLDFSIHVTEKGKKEALFEKKVFDIEQFDGILFADIDGDVALLEKIRAKKVPYIVMNNFFLKENISCIGIDNRAGAKEAVEYLIELGHKEIATITGNLTTQAGTQRLEGYKDAHSGAKIGVKKDYIQKGDFIRKGAREAAKDLLTLVPRPTAIFCASDLMATEAISVIEERGLKVPDDISVVGFDNSPLALECHVPLTTVEQPLLEMARQATESLNMIIQNRAKAPVKILLPAKLVKRESCKRVER